MRKLASLSLLILTMLFILSCEEESDENSSSVNVNIQGGGTPPLETVQIKSQVMITTSASSLKLKVYRIGLSANGNCSNPRVFNLEGSYLDFMDDPDLGQGQIPPSGYKCVIIEMSDLIKFTPSSNVGSNCDSTVEYTQDVCALDASLASSIPAYTLLDGTNGGRCSPTEGTEDRVVMYLSVDALTRAEISALTDASSAYVYPPKSSDPMQVDIGGQTFDIYGGFNLSSSFEAMSDSTGIFYMDATNQVSSDDANNGCFIDVPIFGFYKE